jgi:hypothetical protein
VIVAPHPAIDAAEDHKFAATRHSWRHCMRIMIERRRCCCTPIIMF